MPKIPPIRAERLIKILKHQGFVLNRIKGSHHILVHIEKQIRLSIPVHHGTTLGKGITLSIIKDAGLSSEEFLSLLRKK